VEVDLAKAMQYYHFAADKGYPPALASLASMYEEGRGTEKDTQRAESYRQLFNIISDKLLNGDY
jgi:TPR repeat protein